LALGGADVPPTGIIGVPKTVIGEAHTVIGKAHTIFAKAKIVIGKPKVIIGRNRLRRFGESRIFDRLAGQRLSVFRLTECAFIAEPRIIEGRCRCIGFQSRRSVGGLMSRLGFGNIHRER
jgi:hypothetical protein